jgi:hypothetical protein
MARYSSVVAFNKAAKWSSAQEKGAPALPLVCVFSAFAKMFATQAALGALPCDMQTEIDSFRCHRVPRAKTTHNRQALALGAEMGALPPPQGCHRW